MAEDEAAGTAPEESADAAELQRIFSSYESDVEVRACPAPTKDSVSRERGSPHRVPVHAKADDLERDSNLA